MCIRDSDYTTPSLDSPVTEGMGRVRVHRVTYTENTARETVPYETEYLDETAESTGKYSHEVLVQAGQDGLVDVTYRQKYVDGGYSSTCLLYTSPSGARPRPGYIPGCGRAPDGGPASG